MHPSAATSQPCLVCGRPTSQWCSRCHNAFYCSPEHLRSDWQRHRKQCRPSPAIAYGSNMIATPPPAESEPISVSAILFPTNGDLPRIIIVKCRPPNDPSHGPCPVPLLQSYFDAPPESVILTQGSNWELLPSPLHVFYSPTPPTMGSPINRSIYNITSGAAFKPWYGNVVVLKFSGSRRQAYTEVGSSDLPALSAYFRSYQ
ncbi:hypothetical protein B0H19DRAFT_1260689 [Mycena capillaripes]|nr:hypothetical protein B0H19DRAFT_1260689 [Mycena capillaripes]